MRGIGLVASLAAAACNVSSADDDQLRAGFEEQFIGGWDGSDTGGPSVLLLREGLVGTLNAVAIFGTRSEFELSFAVEGTLAEDGIGLNLALICAEARSRATGTDSVWSKMDCSGWELELVCGLAGDCSNGDCNMVCDAVYFGDGYGRAGVSLAAVEDEFDYWKRV